MDSAYYFTTSTGGDAYDEFIHDVIGEWKIASERIEVNSNYLYTCEANPLETDYE